MNPLVRPHALLLVFFFTLAAYAFFLAFPDLDQKIAALFYDSETHSFPLRYDPIFVRLQKSVDWGIPIYAGLLIIGLGLHYTKHLLPNSLADRLPLSKRTLWFLALALALAPGLVVNNGFKDQFGRPRPKELVEFGGEKQFTAPFVMSDQDGKSFVSGHAAGGFYFVALAFVAGRHRFRFYAAGVILGLTIGFGRIAQGRHFLSDVVFSGCITLLVIHLLALLWLRSAPKSSIENT